MGKDFRDIKQLADYKPVTSGTDHMFILLASRVNRLKEKYQVIYECVQEYGVQAGFFKSGLRRLRKARDSVERAES